MWIEGAVSPSEGRQHNRLGPRIQPRLRHVPSPSSRPSLDSGDAPTEIKDGLAGELSSKRWVALGLGHRCRGTCRRARARGRRRMLAGTVWFVQLNDARSPVGRYRAIPQPYGRDGAAGRRDELSLEARRVYLIPSSKLSRPSEVAPAALHEKHSERSPTKSRLYDFDVVLLLPPFHLVLALLVLFDQIVQHPLQTVRV